MHMITQGMDALIVGGPVEHLGRLGQRPTTPTFPLVSGGGEQVSSRSGDAGGLGRISGGAERGRRLPSLPEPKSGKNRMHLDIHVTDVAPEVARLRELGATVLAEPHDDDGWLTAVLADPQGNEFCVIVPPADYDREP